MHLPFFFFLVAIINKRLNVGPDTHYFSIHGFCAAAAAAAAADVDDPAT